MIISATSTDESGIDAEKEITVYPATQIVDLLNKDSVVLSGIEIKMKIGETPALNVGLSPADANPVFKWSSYKEKVASVSNDGIVTALSTGKATITIKTDNGEVYY